MNTSRFKSQPMQWTRSETLALAQQSCTWCYGLGLRPGRRGKDAPCNCVFRAIFRACYERFRYCSQREKAMSQVRLEKVGLRSSGLTWGLKDEEFCADFCLVSRRLLEDRQYDLFRYHFLLGGDWKICCKKLNIDRGTFFHEVYRVEQLLGRGFRELTPYPLFPVDSYFNGAARSKPTGGAALIVDDGIFAQGGVETAIEKSERKKYRFPFAAGSGG